MAQQQEEKTVSKKELKHNKILKEAHQEQVDVLFKSIKREFYI
jgi:hypothetical protein